MRKLIAIALAALLAVSMVACSSNAPATNNSAATSTTVASAPADSSSEAASAVDSAADAEDDFSKLSKEELTKLVAELEDARQTMYDKAKKDQSAENIAAYRVALAKKEAAQEELDNRK